MTGEQRFILESLKDFCHDRSTDRPSYSVDVSKVFEVTGAQNLDGLIYEQTRGWIDRTLSGKHFKEALLSHAFLSANRADQLRRIVAQFKEAGIPLTCMKGSVFRDYYPVPELRSMGDIDFIIRPKDREASDRIMREKLGYERLIDNHSVWTYWTGQIMFEIHDHMFYEYLANRFNYRDYFDAVWDHVHEEKVFGVVSDNLYVPDENFHFLYLMAHTAKHIINNGSGFRAYIDMVKMCQAKGSQMDWVWISRELAHMQLLDFTKTCFALCERWFGVRMPLEKERLNDAFFERVTVKTFRDGIFGLDNMENREARTAKEIQRSGGIYGISALFYVLKELFPSYEDIRLVPWYAFVDGRPWLLPAAWIYRWVYCLVNKRKSSAEHLSEPFARRTKVEKRQKLIHDWGL